MTPCAGCPSPILAPPAPRVSELRMLGNGEAYAVEEFHPGCWAVEVAAVDAVDVGAPFDHSAPERRSAASQ